MVRHKHPSLHSIIFGKIRTFQFSLLHKHALSWTKVVFSFTAITMDTRYQVLQKVLVAHKVICLRKCWQQNTHLFGWLVFCGNPLWFWWKRNNRDCGARGDLGRVLNTSVWLVWQEWRYASAAQPGECLKLQLVCLCFSTYLLCVCNCVMSD